MAKKAKAKKSQGEGELTNLLLDVLTDNKAREQFTKKRRDFLKKFKLSPKARKALLGNKRNALRPLVDTNQQTSLAVRERVLNVIADALLKDAQGGK